MKQWKINRNIKLILLAIALVSIIFLIVSQAGLASRGSEAKPVATIKIGEKTIKIEVASDEESRAKGLSGRDGLAQDKGLLMIFEEPGKYGIWMKDMKFSIDIFWIKGNKIVYAEKNVSPPVAGTPDALLSVYMPSNEADMVLETTAGFADENKIQVGDIAEFMY